ncbi:MAG: hypothetical protein HQK54_13965 [Oligoflexales bacterium]|nr:hypothetical protein [Oligoflexales bacterium]
MNKKHKNPKNAKIDSGNRQKNKRGGRRHRHHDKNRLPKADPPNVFSDDGRVGSTEADKKKIEVQTGHENRELESAKKRDARALYLRVFLIVVLIGMIVYAIVGIITKKRAIDEESQPAAARPEAAGGGFGSDRAVSTSGGVNQGKTAKPADGEKADSRHARGAGRLKPPKKGSLGVAVENIEVKHSSDEITVNFDIKSLRKKIHKGYVYLVATYQNPSGKVLYRVAPSEVRINSNGEAENPENGVTYSVGHSVNKSLKFQVIDTKENLKDLKLFVKDVDGSYLSRSVFAR